MIIPARNKGALSELNEDVFRDVDIKAVDDVLDAVGLVIPPEIGCRPVAVRE